MRHFKPLLPLLLIAAAPAAEAAPSISAVGEGAPSAQMFDSVVDITSALLPDRHDAGVVTLARVLTTAEAERGCDLGEDMAPFELIVERYDGGALGSSVEYQGVRPSACDVIAFSDHVLVEMSFTFDAALYIE